MFSSDAAGRWRGVPSLGGALLRLSRNCTSLAMISVVRRCWGWGRGCLLGLPHEQVPQDLLGDLEPGLELGNAVRLELKVLEDECALLLLLDLVGELALAPQVGPLGGAT